MIERADGDIFASDAEALVNAVNCVGVMGRGLAAQFKERFPENFCVYAEACARGEVEPGKMLVVPTGAADGPRFIVNFPTKRHWRAKSQLEDIEDGLRALVDDVVKLGIGSIAVPPLGCGLGGLDWDEVRPRIVRAFDATPELRVLLHEPVEPAPKKRGARKR